MLTEVHIKFLDMICESEIEIVEKIMKNNVNTVKSVLNEDFYSESLKYVLKTYGIKKVVELLGVLGRYND